MEYLIIPSLLIYSFLFVLNLGSLPDIFPRVENIIEEVYDDDESSELSDGRIVDGNLWIKEYSLLTNPDKIDLSQLEVSKKLLERLISEK